MKLESLKSSKFEALDQNQMAFITGGYDKQDPSYGITTCRTGDDNQHGDSDLSVDQGVNWYHDPQFQQLVDLQVYAVQAN